MAVRRKAKMKGLGLIALIMVLGLSGCASSGMSGLIKEDWTEFWNDPGGGSWEVIKWDWTEFLN